MKRAAAILCVLCLCACGDHEQPALDKESARRFEGRLLLVESEMIIHRSNTDNDVVKYIVTPPPGVRNRFILERIVLSPGRRLVLKKMEWRKHWSGVSGAVPIVALLGDERLAGIEIDFHADASFDIVDGQLRLASPYIKLLPDAPQ